MSAMNQFSVITSNIHTNTTGTSRTTDTRIIVNCHRTKTIPKQRKLENGGRLQTPDVVRFHHHWCCCYFYNNKDRAKDYGYGQHKQQHNQHEQYSSKCHSAIAIHILSCARSEFVRRKNLSVIVFIVFIIVQVCTASTIQNHYHNRRRYDSSTPNKVVNTTTMITFCKNDNHNNHDHEDDDDDEAGGSQHQALLVSDYQYSTSASLPSLIPNKNMNKLWPPWPFNYLSTTPTPTTRTKSMLKPSLSPTSLSSEAAAAAAVASPFSETTAMTTTTTAPTMTQMTLASPSSMTSMSRSTSSSSFSKSPSIRAVSVLWKFTWTNTGVAIRQIQEATSHLWFHLPPATSPLMLLSLIPQKIQQAQSTGTNNAITAVGTTAGQRIGIPPGRMTIPLFSNSLIRNIVLSGIGLALLSWAHSEIHSKKCFPRMVRPLMILYDKSSSTVCGWGINRVHLPPFLPEYIPEPSPTSFLLLSSTTSSTIKQDSTEHDADDANADAEDDVIDEDIIENLKNVAPATVVVTEGTAVELSKQDDKVWNSFAKIIRNKNNGIMNNSTISNSVKGDDSTTPTKRTKFLGRRWRRNAIVDIDDDSDTAPGSKDNTVRTPQQRSWVLRRFLLRKKNVRELRKRERHNTNRLAIYNELVARQEMIKEHHNRHHLNRNHLRSSHNHQHSNNNTNTSNTSSTHDIGSNRSRTQRYALITGASRGIGRAIAIELARWEIPLILVARDEQSLLRLSNDIEACYGVNCYVLPADLSVPGCAELIYEATKKAGLEVDYLINNAGISTFNELSVNIPLERINQMIQVNTVSVTALTHLYGQEMKNRRHGRIMMVSSVSGAVSGIASVAVYAATKAYENSLSYSLAKELEPYGVGVTCLQPGAVKGTGLRDDSNSQQALCWKVPFYSDTPPHIAHLGVVGMLRGDADVTPGMLNRIFLKVLRPVVPQRIHNLIAEAFWTPFHLPFGQRRQRLQ